MLRIGNDHQAGSERIGTGERRRTREAGSRLRAVGARANVGGRGSATASRPVRALVALRGDARTHAARPARNPNQSAMGAPSRRAAGRPRRLGGPTRANAHMQMRVWKPRPRAPLLPRARLPSTRVPGTKLTSQAPKNLLDHQPERGRRGITPFLHPRASATDLVLASRRSAATRGTSPAFVAAGASGPSLLLVSDTGHAPTCHSRSLDCSFRGDDPIV